MRRRYAERTEVPVDRSRTEIEQLLRRYGADQFMYGTDHARALVGFRAHGKHVRFLLPLPDLKDDQFRRTPTGRIRRNPDAPTEAYEAECRRRWRALALSIKGKLEAVETGIAIFDSEFMAHIVMPDGKTVGEHVLPSIEAAYSTGRMPQALLPQLEGA